MARRRRFHRPGVGGGDAADALLHRNSHQGKDSLPTLAVRIGRYLHEQRLRALAVHCVEQVPEALRLLEDTYALGIGGAYVQLYGVAQGLQCGVAV